VAPYDILTAMAGGHHSRRDVPPLSSGAPKVLWGGAPKVPAVRPYFWAVKLLTTAMGEAVSDFLVKQFNQYLAVMAGFVVFAIAIAWQFRTRGYRTWPYWSAVAMVAVFGTMVADSMHIGLGIPYAVSASLFAICLMVTFAVWYRVEGTLSIHSIVTPRREFFYWATVIFTFALGTATGDLTATTFHLGYLESAFLFIGAICVPLVAWRLGANPVLTFWVAYILTRPIGASFADFFGMPKDVGGMGIGHGPVSLVTLALVLASFVYLSRSGIDTPEFATAATAPGGHAATAPGGHAAMGGLLGSQQGYPRGGGWTEPQQADGGWGRQPQQAQPQPSWQPDPRYPDPQYADPRYADPRNQQRPDAYGRTYPDSSGDPSGWSR